MKVGDTIELKIDSQGMNGEGVARHEGVVVFLPYTLKGESVLAKILSLKKNFANARAVKILMPSADRVAPICPVYFKCGGCDFMHIKADSHKGLKQAELINNFKKIAGLDIAIDEWVDSDRQLGYRNKVQLPFGVVNGRVAVGYFSEGSHDFIPHDKCYLQDDWADNLAKIVLNFANTRQISVYNEKTGKGLLRHLVMRKLGDEVAITLVINADRLDGMEQLVADITRAQEKFSLHLNINKAATNVIMSNVMKTVYGKAKTFTEILGAKVAVSPLSFMQINDYIRDKIYLNVREELHGVSVLLDLYSGVGVTSNVLAKSCKSIYSIEIVEDAVRDARELIELNGNQNIITPICGDVAVQLPKLINDLRANNILPNPLVAENANGDKVNIDIQHNEQLGTKNLLLTEKASGNNVDSDSQYNKQLGTDNINIEKNTNGNKENSDSKYAVLLDPPRKGCDRQVLEKILETAPDKIIYISCNHATLARDINIFKDNYKLTHLAAYDMFPNTHHIETLVCLTRKN